MLHIDEQIKNIDDQICEKLENSQNICRGSLSADIIQLLRHFLEAIFIKLENPNSESSGIDYKSIKKGIAYVKSTSRFKELNYFHDCLQETVSHYVPNKDEAERLMLKYYEYLLKIRYLLSDSFGLQVLRNLDQFPINQDKSLIGYYEKIAEKIESLHSSWRKFSRYCYRIIKNKPFFIHRKIYYEVTFSSIQDRNSKFDRVIAFTKHKILDNYAVKMILNESSIEILDKKMPVKIITDWRVSIRPCEFKNLKRIFNSSIADYKRDDAYNMWMEILTKDNMTLLDVLELSEDKYFRMKENILNSIGIQYDWVSEVLDLCRPYVLNQREGSNIIRYLLYTMDNNVIKDQLGMRPCFRLDNLYLKWGCIPFDKEPFYFSLIGHNAKFYDILCSIGVENREHEILARYIKNNIERQGMLFTPIEDLSSFQNLNILISTHNNLLWKGNDGQSGHIGQKIISVNNGKFVVIKSYLEDIKFILKTLEEMSDMGMDGYEELYETFIKKKSMHIDDEKKIILSKLYRRSKVSLIYGPAGTGKTTIIKHISQVLENKSKLFLAQTNPAVQNLQRKVPGTEAIFSTITKYLNKEIDVSYDLIIIDECSTVSNSDMRRILEKDNYSYLLLVGDVFQIESISFGNWFALAPKFVPKKCCYELSNNYRTEDKNLLSIWKRVRELKNSNDILELLTHYHCTRSLDKSIFQPFQDDEIILCLNYDGLYGINNINHFMQSNNYSHAEKWDVHLFKENDPILFKDSERFKGLFYNNLKGRIKKIEKEEGRIWFTLSVDLILNEWDAKLYSIELLSAENEKSIVRFAVDKNESDDEDEMSTSKAVIPFQIAYAVSIHKAQGLEYDSVKIVISSEVNEQISHNIFYTAITRARKEFQIYWTPETEKRVLEKMQKKDIHRDADLLKYQMSQSSDVL